MAKVSPTILSAALFTAIFTVGAYFLVLPALRNNTEQRAQLDSLTSNGNLTQTNQAQVDTAAQEQTKETALVLLPPADNQYDLAIQMDALSHSLGIPFTSLAFTGSAVGPAQPAGTVATSAAAAASASASNSALKPLGFTITLTNSYTGIQRLIQGLVTLNRQIEIQQVSMGITSTGTTGASLDPNALDTQISGVAYYLPAAVSTSATPKPTP